MPKLFKNVPWKSETATVADLIAALQKYPPEMLVAYTWEGQIVPVVVENVEIFQETESINGPVLLLDAETG